MTATVALVPAVRLAAPKEQPEKEEEDEADPDLASDTEQNELRGQGFQPDAEDISPEAKGGDGTINPPFP